MSVVGESERHLGAQKRSPVGKLSFIPLDGALIADLPLTIEGATEPYHFHGKVALAADALLNRQITSTETLSLVLGIPTEQVGERVEKVANVAKRAGITISRDPDHGDGYSIVVNRQRNSPARGSRGVVHPWRSADGSHVPPGWLSQVGGIPESGTRRINGPQGDSAQRMRRG